MSCTCESYYSYTCPNCRVRTPATTIGDPMPDETPTLVDGPRDLGALVRRASALFPAANARGRELRINWVRNQLAAVRGTPVSHTEAAEAVDAYDARGRE